jgi:hypothetical protein
MLGAQAQTSHRADAFAGTMAHDKISTFNRFVPQSQATKQALAF